MTEAAVTCFCQISRAEPSATDRLPALPDAAKTSRHHLSSISLAGCSQINPTRNMRHLEKQQEIKVRHTFQLSTQTIKVLTGNVATVADEYGCSPQNIHAILAGTETDTFAKFEWLYRAAVKAGCDVSHWRRRLEAIDMQYHEPSGHYALPDTAAMFTHEAGEVIEAYIRDDAADKQWALVEDAIQAAHRHVKALRQRSVNESDHRAFAREAVSKRRAA